MGFDINGFKSELFSFGKQIAQMGGDVNHIDPGVENSAFTAEVELRCKAAGVDSSEIYRDTNIAELMGANLSSTNAVYTDNEMDEMWSLAGLTKPADADKQIAKNIEGYQGMEEAGFDIAELEDLFGEDSEVIAYTIEAFANGDANRISKESEDKEYGADISANFFDALEYIKFNRGNV